MTLRTILELGSGIGFTGIAICKSCQPRTFIFSDCHPRVLTQLGQNLQLNGLTPEPGGTWSTQTEPQGQEGEGQSCQTPTVIVAELDWGSVTEKQLLALRAEVVIAAGTAGTGSRGGQGSATPAALEEEQITTASYRLFVLVCVEIQREIYKKSNNGKPSGSRMMVVIPSESRMSQL